MNENILVCISNPEHAEKLIQRGKLLSTAFRCDCLVVSVQKGIEDEMDFNQLQLQLFFDVLSKKHDVRYIRTFAEGKQISSVIAALTEEYGITQIVLGQSVQTKLEMVMKSSLINELFQKLEGVDIHVVEVTRNSLGMKFDNYERGTQARLIKTGEEFCLVSYSESKEDGGIRGVFFRETTTDFMNGFLVVHQEGEHLIVKINDGLADFESVEALEMKIDEESIFN